jgi:Peptidase inhibitor family I36
MFPRKGSPGSRRVALIAGAVTGVAMALAGFAGPASASPAAPVSGPVSCGTGCAIINEFNTGGTKCQDINANADFCLWYSPNMKGGVWVWAGGAKSVPVITASFTDGDGKVRNNAASAANAGGCTVGIFVTPNYVGDLNSIGWGWGGNLTSNPPLRNNEASVRIQCD